LVSINLRPNIVVLEEVTNAESLPELEKLAIAHYRSMGFDLVNGTDGGEGCLGRCLTDDAKRRVGEAQKNRVRSDVERKNISEAQKKRFENGLSDEHRQRLSNGQKKRAPETRLSAAHATASANSTRVWTIESRRKLSETKKRLGQRPPERTPRDGAKHVDSH
jgi:hypothetical protein